MHLPRKGRGYALRAAWSTSDAPVVAYMDVDLSTSLPALLPLVAPLLSGHRDVAIGSRLAPGAHVVRGPKRELISRAYNLLLKLALRGRFSDAQCGFKALRRDAAERLLPLVEDNEWFFDTELLVTAQRLGLRIGEVPVDWVDDPDSRVNIVSTATDDLRGVWRMLVRRPEGLRRVRSNEVAADQLLRFAGVGVVSTLGYLFLFVAWRPLVGPFAANAVAMAIATLFNTAVHRELSRTTDGQTRRGRLFAVAGALYLVSLGLTTLGLVVAQWIAPSALIPELVAITVANGIAAAFRFAVLRAWIFRPGTRAGRRPHGGVTLTDLTPAPDAPVGVLDPPAQLDALEGCGPLGGTRRTGMAIRPPAWAHVPLRAGQGERRALGAPRPPHAARRDGRSLPVGPRRERVGQLLLLGRRAGGHQELEGVLLRVLRLVQLHHRRQAARVLVADGDLGPDLRPQLVERAGAAGPRGRGHGRPGLPVRPALVQRAGRAPRRRRRRARRRWRP